VAAEGLVHHGVEFLFDGQRVPVALSELTGGKSVMVYGQTEVTCDLMAARPPAAHAIVYGVSEVVIHDAKSDRPTIYLSEGETCRLVRFIAGCDGSTACRGKVFPATSSKPTKAFGRLAGLGLLADTHGQSRADLCASSTGFVLCQRSLTRSRYYHRFR
jgi:p-hydroxybenzoate 3-monooxygenase